MRINAIALLTKAELETYLPLAEVDFCTQCLGSTRDFAAYKEAVQRHEMEIYVELFDFRGDTL